MTRRRVVLASVGPLVRIELWSGYRLEHAYELPTLDAHAVEVINTYVGIQMMVRR